LHLHSTISFQHSDKINNTRLCDLNADIRDRLLVDLYLHAKKGEIESLSSSLVPERWKKSPVGGGVSREAMLVSAAGGAGIAGMGAAAGSVGGASQGAVFMSTAGQVGLAGMAVDGSILGGTAGGIGGGAAYISTSAQAGLAGAVTEGSILGVLGATAVAGGLIVVGTGVYLGASTVTYYYTKNTYVFFQPSNFRPVKVAPNRIVAP